MIGKLHLTEIINPSNSAIPLVILMCGVAGAGKTTFALQLEQQGFTRLSIDEEIWTTNGRYAIDYPAEMYEQLKTTAEIKLRQRLLLLLNAGKNVVIDFSFWQRKKRNEYKKLITNAGGEWKLVYLKVPLVELQRRLLIRSERFDANAAFKITDEILTDYLNGFEAPNGEGEILIPYE